LLLAIRTILSDSSSRSLPLGFRLDPFAIPFIIDLVFWKHRTSSESDMIQSSRVPRLLPLPYYVDDPITSVRPLRGTDPLLLPRSYPWSYPSIRYSGMTAYLPSTDPYTHLTRTAKVLLSGQLYPLLDPHPQKLCLGPAQGVNACPNPQE